MRLSSRVGFAFGLLMVLTPSALACSWGPPGITRPVWTEDGLVFQDDYDLRKGNAWRSEKIADLTPFAGWIVAPNGTLAYYQVGVGGVGGDCRVPYTITHRWTPGGVENVTAVMPTLPAAVHWPSGRGLFLEDGGNATVRVLATGEVRARFEPGRASSIVEFGGPRPTYFRSAAWSPDGEKIALVTENDVWIFRDDGEYLYDSYPSFSVQGAVVAFSPTSDTLGIAWPQADRQAEVRLLDLRDPDALHFGGGFADVRGLQAIAYGPRGELAVALQEHPLYSEAPSSNSGSILFFGEGLGSLGNITWEGRGIGPYLAWSPSGDALVAIVGGELEHVDPAEALRAAPRDVVIRRDWLPIPGASAALVAVVLAGAVALARQRPRS